MVRSDARENRARILEAARHLFAEDGATSMNLVAQRAGVGPGTLYRNYPTREALVLAVYQLDVDQLTQLLDAGKRDGTIRADADPGDFLQLTGALWRAAAGPEDRSQPMLGLILDGLSPRGSGTSR